MLLGRNGAGKTTTLRTIMGLWRASAGEHRLRRPDITALATPDIARPASPTCRRTWAIFADLTVRENLVLAARGGRHDPQRARMDLRPVSRRSSNSGPLPAGVLSGGQKQMLADRPRHHRAAPASAHRRADQGAGARDHRQHDRGVRELKRSGATILLVEQNFMFARALGDRVAVMDDGARRACGTNGCARG